MTIRADVIPVSRQCTRNVEIQRLTGRDRCAAPRAASMSSRSSSWIVGIGRVCDRPKDASNQYGRLRITGFSPFHPLPA